MMAGKHTIRLFQLLSLLVILSLVVTSCVPSSGLEGTGGQEEVPATEEPAATEPPTEAPAEAPPATEPPTEAPPTEAPTEPPTEAPAQATATSTPTPTATATTDPNAAQAGQAQGGAVVAPPTSTSTPTPTSTSAPANRQDNQGAVAPAAVNDPYVGLGVACNNDLSATFTVTNIGGPLSGGSYTVSEPGKSPVTSPLNLNSNQSISFNAAGNATVTVNYSTSELDNVTLQAVGTCLPLPTSTFTPTATATRTPGFTATPTTSRTPTVTRTPTATKTPTSTITPGPSPTPSNTSTATPTKTPRPTRTPTSTITPGPSPTFTSTKTPTPTKTATNTVTPGPSPTITSTKTPTPSKTPRPSNTPTLTSTPTNTQAPTFTATTTFTPSPTPTPVDGQLDLKVFCNVDQTATFFITNISGSVSDGIYVLSDPSQTGPVDLQPKASVTIKGAGNATMTVTYKTSFLSSVTLNVTGSCSRRPTATPTSTATATATPTTQPVALNVQGSCSGVNSGTATFIVTNNGGTMLTAYNYSVTDAGGAVVSSGVINNLQSGQSTIITVSGNSTSYTLSSPDDASLTTVVDMTTCQLPPPPPPPASLNITGVCTSNVGEATFVITNTGNTDMATPYTYAIVDANGALAGSGTIDLNANQSTTIKVTGSSATYTFASPNDASLTTVVDMSTCTAGVVVLPPPSPTLSISGVCTSNAGEATFVITNTGTIDMSTPYTYVIIDAGGAVAASGTIDLNASQSTTIKVTGSSSLYTFSSSNDSSLTTVVDMSTCVAVAPPPPPPPADLSINGVCTSAAGVATFVLKNNGADMTAPYPYTIKDASGAIVQTGTISLLAGQSITLTVTGSSTGYTFATPSDAKLTTVVDMTTCVVPPPPPPSLAANGVCVSAEVATFSITNNGGDMPAPLAYTITDQAGNVIQSGTIQLNAGENQKLTVTGAYGILTLALTDASGTTVSAAMTDCAEPTLAVAPGQPDICIQCLVFHTFRDENLEVYRLDGIEGQPGYKLYNLSKDEAVDSRPSRSPNDSTVAFQSNRNGNVELYYTDLLGSGDAIRLTESQSNNTNPMYGPDARTIAFQSDRNGRFDLFTIDQQTREETQRTSDPADDINAFFSPDIKKLVFQSNRNGNWDLFILDLETGTEFQLTDSSVDETFPAWSSNGRQIAFTSDVDGLTDLYVIDLDTMVIRELTTDGKTVNAVWSPEGNRIAYQSERNGNLDIYSFDFKDDKEYRVTDYDGQDSGPTWDCGGTNLAFTSIRDGDPNIFQVFWQGGTAGNMTIDPATDKWSQWRPSNDVSSVGY